MDTETMRRLMEALDAGTNIFGALKPGIRARLFAVVDRPDSETWSDAQGIILNARGGMMGTTLWQALLHHTNYDVRSGPSYVEGEEPVWPQEMVPTSEQLLAAITAELERDTPS